MTSHGAQVTQIGALDIQVCVPQDWTDEQVNIFVKAYCPRISMGWSIRRQGWSFCAPGNYKLVLAPERAPCSERPGFVHIMLDA
jgi:hypothetical protein